MSTRFSKFLPDSGNDGSESDLDIDVADLVEESVAVFDLTMKVKAWNAEAERLYGWRREEVIGGAVQAAVQCSPSDPLKQILAQILAPGDGIWRGEFTRTTKDGRSVVVKAKWSLRRDRAGTAIDVVETSRDITEIRRTEEALDRVHYQYQNLFQASVASFWELDFAAVGTMVRALRKSGVSDLRAYFRDHPEYVRRMIQETRIIDINEQSLLMFSKGNRDELLSSLDPLWPDESLGVFAESVVAAFERRAHYSSEAVFCSLDGRRFDTLFTVSYPPDMSRSARLLVGITDVTQAKKARFAQEQSERRYHDVFHFLPVALLQLEGQELLNLLDRARSEGVADFPEYLKLHPDVMAQAQEGLKIVEVNRRTVDIFRAHSVDEFTGSVARYWTESPDVFRSLMGARYAGKAGFEAQVKMRAHDGTIIDALFFAAFGAVTGQRNISLVGLIDVSDRVKAQEMLAQVQVEIAHAARVSVLGELTASLAHEVSQPLTAIETNTEASLLWLARSPPNIEEVRELSARTAAEVQRAADIIHRIRSMAARTNPEQHSIPLNPVIQEAMLFLKHELQRNDVRASFLPAPNLPNVIGDRVQLQQVIVNLAVNAIQAMAHAGSLEREVVIRTSGAPDDRVSIEVDDTGPGVAEQSLGRLFESFFTTKSTGLGIGLTICRSIIEAHGGRITVRNRADCCGAQFSIVLPTRPSHEDVSVEGAP